MKRFFVRFPSALLTFALGFGMVSVLAKAYSPEPYEPAANPRANKEKTLEMVFVLDTTGSMGGLIEGAKQRIWGIVNEVMQTPARPNVRVGLVAYSDSLRFEHGDAITVTTVYPGYIRTGIHAASQAAGLGLTERLEALLAVHDGSRGRERHHRVRVHVEDEPSGRQHGQRAG